MTQQGQILNLAKLQLTLDEIVFENIDTGHKWAHAQSLLENLYQDSEQYFKSHVASNEGKLPKDNSYWALFMDLTAKLTYFIAFCKQQQNVNDPSLEEQFRAAASYLPNCQHESCEELSAEIRTSYKQVTGEELVMNNLSIEDTIQNFYHDVM